MAAANWLIFQKMDLCCDTILQTLHTFRDFIILGPVFDPLLPGLDVPDPDGADGDKDEDGEHEDAPYNGENHISRIS